MAPALPLHPVVNPFPIVTTVLAALAMVLGALRPPGERREWLTRALLLLTVALALLPAVAWTGRAWAGDAGIWPAGRLLPPRGGALGGLLAAHLLGAAISAGLTLAGLLLALRARRSGRFWAALLVVLAAAAATGITGHLGGRIAFGTPEAEAGP